MSRQSLRSFRSSARGRAVAEGRLPVRDCTKEEQINCIGECEWVKDWWNPFSAGSCRFKETKSMIYDSYCTDSNDPNDLINLLIKIKATGRKAYAKTLAKMSKSDLCQELDNYLESLTDPTGGFDVSNFWSWGITRLDFTRALGYALYAYPSKNIMGTIKFIAGYFKRNKWIRVTAYAVAIAIVFYFVVPQKHIDNISEIVEGYYNAAINYFVPPMEESRPWSWYDAEGIKQPLSAFKESWDETISSMENEDWGKYFDSGDRIVDYIEGDSLDMWIYNFKEHNGGDKFTVSDETFVTFDEATRNSIHHIIDKTHLISAYKRFAYRTQEPTVEVARIIRGDSWQVMLPNTNIRNGDNQSFLPGITNVETYPVQYFDVPAGTDMYTGVKTVLEATYEAMKDIRTRSLDRPERIAYRDRSNVDYINSILAIVYTML